MDIENRNRLRAEVGLPLLSVEAETRRLQAVRDQASFEGYFKQERHRYAPLWSDRRRGFLSNMGIWNAVRKQLLDEMRKD